MMNSMSNLTSTCLSMVFSRTKVRAVFDASARSTTGTSLNDLLLPGPNLYPPLPDVLIRFRRHAVGFSADISKMFREILLNPEHRDLHRFLLRDTDGRVRDCRMEHFTFGVTCSPFLATQALRHLAITYQDSHPAASRAIIHDFYVDDYLAGADTLVEANLLQTELCDLLKQAGMTLRKWRSNSTELLSLIPPDLREKDTTALSLSSSS